MNNFIFPRLTEDVYQTAKVAKVLLLLNEGKGNEFKGKSLSEIEVIGDTCDLEEYKEISNQTVEFSEEENDKIGEIAMSSKPYLSENESDNENIVQNGLGVLKKNKTREMDQKEYSISLKNPTKKNRNQRKRWTAEEKEIVLKYFEKNIKMKVAPKKHECLLLVKQNPSLFLPSDWVRIKTFVYNSYRDK